MSPNVGGNPTAATPSAANTVGPSASNAQAVPPDANGTPAEHRISVESFFGHLCRRWLRTAVCHQQPNCKYAHDMVVTKRARDQLLDPAGRGRRLPELAQLYAFTVEHSQRLFEPFFGIFCAAFALRGQLNDARLADMCNDCLLFERPHLLRAIVDALRQPVMALSASAAVHTVLDKVLGSCMRDVRMRTLAVANACVDLMLATDGTGGAVEFIEQLTVLVQWQVAMPATTATATAMNGYRASTVRPYCLADAAISILMAEAVPSRSRRLVDLLMYVFDKDAGAGCRQPPEMWIQFRQLCSDLNVGVEGSGG